MGHAHGSLPVVMILLKPVNKLLSQLLSSYPLNSKSVLGIASLANMSLKKKVCVVGSGNWGSAIAKIIGYNVIKNKDQFEENVSMWVFEEMIEGKKLTEIINETHVNVKYLPNHPLPANVIAVPDLLDASRDADILVFVVPHQFINRLCDQIFRWWHRTDFAHHQQKTQRTR